MATFFDLIVTPWQARFRGRVMACAVGRGGIGSKQGEGDGVTPVGSYRLLHGYYRADRMPPLRSGIPLEVIKPHSIWSDDPGDPLYNRYLEAASHPFSHERLSRGDGLYDLFAVIDYNYPKARAGAGSAIFLHSWRAPRFPTEGCVALSPGNLRWVIENWTPASRLIIQA